MSWPDFNYLQWQSVQRGIHHSDHENILPYIQLDSLCYNLWTLPLVSSLCASEKSLALPSLCNLASGSGIKYHLILFCSRPSKSSSLIVPRVFQPPNYPHGLLLDMFCLYWDSWPMYCPNWTTFCLYFSLFHFLTFLSLCSSRQGKYHPVFSSPFITKVNQISQAQVALCKSMLVVPSYLLVWQACGSLGFPIYILYMLHFVSGNDKNKN